MIWRRRLLLANGVFLVAATVVHFVLVAAHSGAWVVSRERADAR